MLIRHICAAFAASFAIAASSFATAAAESIRPWPIAIDINLSSSFAEFRSGHLHAGIDIKTAGREGVPCIAIGDGYVSRMRASPFGYGQALYITLNSGETAVYAHLSEFAPELEAELYRQQLEAGTYTVDVYFDDKTKFPVRAGEVIAYTGSTGAAAPHLHFEFRDGQQNPMNPLSHGWHLEDRIPPEIRSVAWMPRGPEARIAGAIGPRYTSLRRIREGAYVAEDTTSVAGRVGLAVRVVDRQNGRSGRLAPYRVELTVDGMQLAAMDLERFSYAHAGEVELAFDMERARTQNQHYFVLFERDGETLWNRTFQNGGVIDTEILAQMLGEHRRSHTAVIRAIDRSGNVATATIPFVVDDDPPSALRTPTQAWSFGVPGSYFFDHVAALAPPLFLRVDPGVEPPFTVEHLQAAHPYELHSKRESLPVAYVLPLKGGEPFAASFSRLGLNVAGEENALYGDAFVTVSSTPAGWRAQTPAAAGLDRVSKPVVIGPVSLVIKKSMRLDFVSAKAGTGREGVYRYDERKGEWAYTGGEAVDGVVRAEVGEPGVYAVFKDVAPPVVTSPRLAKRTSHANGTVWKEIVVAMDDGGSGINPYETAVWVEGQPRIARWDSYRKRLYVTLREEAVPDEMAVVVEAVDWAGNRRRFESSLRETAANADNDRQVTSDGE